MMPAAAFLNLFPVQAPLKSISSLKATQSKSSHYCVLGNMCKITCVPDAKANKMLFSRHTGASIIPNDNPLHW